MTLTEQIPGLAEAIERERHVRESCYVELPETICGFDVPPLTLRHLVGLSAIQSPFVCGGNVQPVDVANLLIFLTGNKSRWFIWRLRRLNFKSAVAAISSFFEETFQDAPAGSGGNDISYYSGAAALVDLFAREYGWTETETLAVPLKRLFQYLKCIARHHDRDAVLFNPSDRVRGEWLRSVNQN